MVLKAKRLTVISTAGSLLISSIAIGALCEGELKRHNEFKEQAEQWGKASMAAMGAGSFLGPAGGLLGAGPGAVSLGYSKMAEDAWKDYERCLEREKKAAKEREEAKRKEVEEAQKNEKDRLEEEKAEDIEELGEVEI